MSKELSDADFTLFRVYIAGHYRKLLGTVPTLHKLSFGTGMHLLMMLDEIEGGINAEKELGTQAANRWIGFVQGALCFAGLSTIDELRADTVACMEKAAIHACVDIVPVGSSEWDVLLYGERVDTFDIGPDENTDAGVAETRMRVVERLHKGAWSRWLRLIQEAMLQTKPAQISAAETQAAIAQARRILRSE